MSESEGVCLGHIGCRRCLQPDCNPILWPVRVFQAKDLVNCGTEPAPEMWGCLDGSNYCGVKATGEYESEAACKCFLIPF